MLPGQVDQQLAAVGVKCDIRRGQSVEAPPPVLHVGNVARRERSWGRPSGRGRASSFWV